MKVITYPIQATTKARQLNSAAIALRIRAFEAYQRVRLHHMPYFFTNAIYTRQMPCHDFGYLN